MQPQLQTHEVERRLALIAQRQHGVIAHCQLRKLGLGREALKYRLRIGRLHQIHRGVYAVGHRALSDHGRWMAAVLASGNGAALSHHSAASLWRIRFHDGPAHVTAPRQLHTRRGIRRHYAQLPSDEVTTEHRIPTTTPARTLFDLASLLTRPALERAIKEADFHRLESPVSLPELLARYPGHRGNRTLRAILGTPSAGVSATELEDLFLALVDEYGLPKPRVNQLVQAGERTFKVDFHWPEQRLIVETDGHQSHATAHGFENDRERDRILSAAGWRVVRITWRQLREDRAAVAADLERLLS